MSRTLRVILPITAGAVIFLVGLLVGRSQSDTTQLRVQIFEPSYKANPNNELNAAFPMHISYTVEPGDTFVVQYRAVGTDMPYEVYMPGSLEVWIPVVLDEQEMEIRLQVRNDNKGTTHSSNWFSVHVLSYEDGIQVWRENTPGAAPDLVPNT